MLRHVLVCLHGGMSSAPILYGSSHPCNMLIMILHERVR